MALEPFTRKFEDNSIETGFQFTFYCDVCSQRFHKSKFAEFKISKKGGIMRDAGRLSGMATKLGSSFMLPGLGGKQAGDTGGISIDKGTETVISERFGQKSPQWHKEHDTSFKSAQEEAKTSFSQCSICNRWTCAHCWDGQKKICIEDAKTVSICPKCNQPGGMGKFCSNCGSPMTLKCSKCGTEFPTGKKFCNNCGSAL